jgi:hypothetical protein
MDKVQRKKSVSEYNTPSSKPCRIKELRIQNRIYSQIYNQHLKNLHLLVISGIGKSNKRQMIPSKGFRSGKVLLWTLILVHIIKVTCVIIPCQLWYNRRNTCETVTVNMLRLASEETSTTR